MRDGVGRVRTVLVLGGTSQIGLAIADALLPASGGTAILAGRDERALAAAGERLAGRRVRTLAYDTADAAKAVEDLLAHAAEMAGDLDAVLVCVGILGDQSTLDVDTVATEESLRTNMIAPAVAAHAAARLLARQGHGVVVVLSSAAAVRPRAEILTYSAAKAGLDRYAVGLAGVVAGTGARVMVVRPGQVRTRMTAGLAEPPFTVDAEQVARAVVHGIASGTTVVYVPAIMRLVMTALRALPAPVFRRLTAVRPRRTPPHPPEATERAAPP